MKMVRRSTGGILLALAGCFLLVWIYYAFLSKKVGTLRVATETIPTVQSHVHPVGDPDALHANWHGSRELTIVPEDMWVTSIRPIVVNAPLDILHHVLLYEAGPPNALCEKTFDTVREWYAASMNTARDPVVFDEPYGIFFKKGTPLVIEAMEHTPEIPYGPGGFYNNVTIAVELNYILARNNKTRSIPVQFYRLRLDDTPCAYPMRHEAFTVPKGARNFVKQPNTANVDDGGKYVFKESGEIIVFGANFWPWKGGTMMRALLNGKTVASLMAQKNANAWSWTIPQQKENIVVQKGDIITAVMEYSNPFIDKDIKDASGMLGFYFAPTPVDKKDDN